MAGGQTKKPGMKKRAPYNPYVAKERQRKYFDARKQENRWKRQKKHIFGSEEGRGSTERALPAAASTRNDEAAEDHHGRHDADEDYERNLAFPSVVKKARSTEEATAPAGTSEKVRKGKVLKPSVEVAELVVGNEQDVRMQQEPRLGRRSRRNRKSKSEAQAMSNGAADDLGAGTSSGDTPPAVEENLSSVQHARQGDLDAEGKAKLSRKKAGNKDEAASSATQRTATASSSTTKGRGTRFAKVYKKLEEQEQEKRRLQEEKEAENAQRSQRRRATKNKRYHKNHLRESQRNKKGQPRMSNVLKTLMMAKGHKLSM